MTPERLAEIRAGLELAPTSGLTLYGIGLALACRDLLAEVDRLRGEVERLRAPCISCGAPPLTICPRCEP